MNENETSSTHSTLKTSDPKPRSREEILAWLDWARQKKEQHQREAEERYAARQRRVKEMMESEYYQIEWV